MDWHGIRYTHQKSKQNERASHNVDLWRTSGMDIMATDSIDPIHRLRIYAESKGDEALELTREEAAEIVKEYDTLDNTYIAVANGLWGERMG